MSDDSSEIFPIEFRHATVQRIIKGVIDGSMRLDLKTAMMTDRSATRIGESWAQIAGLVTDYCSGSHQGKDLAEIERKLFIHFTILRAYGAITETYTQTQAEQDIAKLNARMDSTNNLLIEILAVLKELLKRLD